MSSFPSRWVAQVLQTERDAILRAWSEPTDEREPSGPPAMPPAHVGQVLDALITWLASDASDPALPALDAIAGLTAAERVPALLHGHQRLREVILRRLAAHEPAPEHRARTLDEQLRLHRGIDLAAALATGAQLAQVRLEHDQLGARQAEEASVAREQFFTTISHELRTPLTSILGWAKILREEPPGSLDPALLAKGLATIERNALAQARLIEQMLDLSRTTAGNLRASRLTEEQLIGALSGDAERTSDPGRSSQVLSGAHLLVVDDEDDARELVTMLLLNAGAKVTAVSSVDEALARFDESPPDAVVSDIGMPGKDGYELVRAIRARTAGQPGKLPVVALTAFARSQDRSRALSAGFSTYIPKPVEPTELIMVLATALGRDVALV